MESGKQQNERQKGAKTKDFSSITNGCFLFDLWEILKPAWSWKRRSWGSYGLEGNTEILFGAKSAESS